MNINDYKKVTDRLAPDERCRKEVLSMNKGENKIKQNINEFEENVSGVEVKHGHSAMKYISIAAAFVLVAGGIGTTSYFMNRNGGSQFADTAEDETVSASDTEEVTEAVSEIVTEESTTPLDYDYDAIALELTDKYLESTNVMYFGDVECDLNDSITFYTYDSTDDYWSDNYGGERTFYKVTDERFNSCQDIYENYKKNITSAPIKNTGYTEEYTLPESYFDAQVIDGMSSITSWLGRDVSKFEEGSRVDLRPYHDEEIEVDEEAFSINNAIYVEYKGGLYVSKWAVNYDSAPYYGNGKHRNVSAYTTEPEIIEENGDTFTVSRFSINDYNDEKYVYGAENIFTFTLENGEWKISSVSLGVRPEYDSAIAIQCYLEKKSEYNDIAINCGDIMNLLEVIDYNKETKICKVHAVLHDTQGVDVVDITADVNINPNGNLDVISADITRLKEYDSSLDRQGILYAN
jgi:hypothetical protein